MWSSRGVLCGTCVSSQWLEVDHNPERAQSLLYCIEVFQFFIKFFSDCFWNHTASPRLPPDPDTRFDALWLLWLLLFESLGNTA